MKIKFSLIIATCLIMLFSCSKSSDSGTEIGTTISCSGVTSTFAANVSTLIQTTCATSSGCHASGSSNSGGTLINFTQISNKKITIRAQVLNNIMPQGSTLTTAQKQTIVCWIDAGALNN